MKLSMVLIIAAFFPVFCFAQTQTGNASYNVSKNGLHISHASMSFNTRVRVTNLSNNRQVIATVDSRIPVSDSRVADISREAGDAIGMSPTGYTEVRLEQLPPEQTAVPAQSPAPNPPPEPPPPPVQQRPEQQSVPAPVPVQAPREPIVETIQVVPPPVQYVMVDKPVQTCGSSPFCVVILVLVIIAILLLTAILVLILCMGRVPLWPWYYPVWVRRHLRYRREIIKNRRY